MMRGVVEWRDGREYLYRPFDQEQEQEQETTE